MPRVSVIVPVYNAAPHLAKCLDSLCGQTLRDMEIICVDDGSSDGSSEIIAEYARHHGQLRVITQANAGVAAARNAGLAHARGEYVGFCDADDWVDASLYERLAQGACAHGAEVAYCAVRSEWPDATTSIFQAIAEDGFRELDQKGWLFVSQQVREIVCNKVFRRRLIVDGNLRFRSRDLYYSEDLLFTIECLLRSTRICSVSGPMYYYVQHEEAYSHGFASDKSRQYLRLVKYLDQQYGNDPRWQRVAHLYFAKLFRLAFGHARLHRLQAPQDVLTDPFFRSQAALAWHHRQELDQTSRALMLAIRLGLAGLWVRVPRLMRGWLHIVDGAKEAN